MGPQRTTTAPSRTPESHPKPSVSWAELAGSFLRIGTTVYGGMWGGARELERELVERRGWLSSEELQLRLVLSTLMPSPRFIGLAGLVGYQLRGWWGSVLAVLSLLLPSALMVLAVVVLATQGPLPPVLRVVQRAVSVAVVGVLLGNAWHLVGQPSLGRRRRLAGVALAAVVGGAVHGGVPLAAVALAGLLVGWVLLRREAPP